MTPLASHFASVLRLIRNLQNEGALGKQVPASTHPVVVTYAGSDTIIRRTVITMPLLALLYRLALCSVGLLAANTSLIARARRRHLLLMHMRSLSAVVHWNDIVIGQQAHAATDQSCQLANPGISQPCFASFCPTSHSTVALSSCIPRGLLCTLQPFDVGSWVPARTMMSRALLTTVFAVTIGSALLYPLLVKIRRRRQESRPDGILVISNPPDAKFE